jgi:hypothetical protein
VGQLILGQGFGWKQVQSTRIGITQQCVEDGQIVTQGLPGGRTGDDDDALTLQGCLDGLRLVGKEPLNAPSPHGANQSGVKALRPRRVTCRPGWQALPGGDVSHKPGVGSQLSQQI